MIIVYLIAIICVGFTALWLLASLLSDNADRSFWKMPDPPD
jgi:uncharacterized NAD(P)/FAD-binding protein YdhS